MSVLQRKITVVGAGYVGMSAAQKCAEKNLAAEICQVVIAAPRFLVSMDKRHEAVVAHQRAIIGWYGFVQGFIAKGWAIAQQEYYEKIRSRKSIVCRRSGRDG